MTFYGVRGSCPVSGPAYARYGGSTSCVLVDVAEDEPLIIDLGTGLRQLGHDLADHPRWGGQPLRATVLLTHLHYDHLIGFPFFTPFHGAEAELDLYGPEPVEGPLASVLAAAIRPPFFPVHLDHFQGKLRIHQVDAERLSVGSATVFSEAIAHSGRTLGYRIEAGGRAVAYLSDHQAPDDQRSVPDPVRRMCQGVDLLIHDAQYSDEEFALKQDWGHSTVAYAVRLAAEVGATRLMMFHHDPNHDDATVDGLLDRARQMPEARRLAAVDAAHEGLTVQL